MAGRHAKNDSAGKGRGKKLLVGGAAVALLACGCFGSCPAAEAIRAASLSR